MARRRGLTKRHLDGLKPKAKRFEERDEATDGETEEAMTWLERAYEERDPLLLVVKVDPRMDPLRSDPRFQDLLRRIGFPES